MKLLFLICASVYGQGLASSQVRNWSQVTFNGEICMNKQIIRDDCRVGTLISYRQLRDAGVQVASDSITFPTSYGVIKFGLSDPNASGSIWVIRTGSLGTPNLLCDSETLCDAVIETSKVGGWGKMAGPFSLYNAWSPAAIITVAKGEFSRAPIKFDRCPK